MPSVFPEAYFLTPEKKARLTKSHACVLSLFNLVTVSSSLSRHPFKGLISRTKGKPALERLQQSEAGDDGVAVASAGPYTNHLHLASGR